MEIALAVLGFVLMMADTAGNAIGQVLTKTLSKKHADALSKVAKALASNTDIIAKLKNRRVNSISDLEKIMNEFPRLRSQIQKTIDDIKVKDANFDAQLGAIDAELQSKRDQLYAMNTDSGYFGISHEDKSNKITELENEIDTLTLKRDRFVKDEEDLDKSDPIPSSYNLSDKSDLSYISQSSKGGTNK